MTESFVLKNQLIFEEAKAADAAEVENLYRCLIDDPKLMVKSEQIDTVRKDEFNFLFVGRVEGNIVATAFLTICRDVMYGDQPYAVVENVVVHPEFRRHGVGRGLMEHVRIQAKARRCTKIMLLSSSKRSEAHSFFEKCGYDGSAKRAFVNYINRSKDVT